MYLDNKTNNETEDNQTFTDVKVTTYENFKGRKIISIEGLQEESEEIKILFDRGATIRMYHEQECCEYVAVTQVDGSVDRHIGAIFISIKEKVLQDEDVPDYNGDGEGGITASFYDLVTSKGILSFRWTGESNGHYSERVTVDELEEPK